MATGAIRNENLGSEAWMAHLFLSRSVQTLETVIIFGSVHQ